MTKIYKLIETTEGTDLSDALNANNLIDVAKLFNNVLGESGSGYDNLQLFEARNTSVNDFDADDIRREIIEDEVRAGGALLFDSNSADYVVFSWHDMRAGVESISVGTSIFEVQIEETTEVNLLSVYDDEDTLDSCKLFFDNDDDILDDIENSELKFYRISFNNVPSQHHVIVSSKFYYVQSELGWAAYPTDQFELEEAVKLEFEIEIEE